MPLAFTAGGPMSDRWSVPLSNDTTGGLLEANRWPAGGCTKEPLAMPQADRQRATSGLRVGFLC